ncbi:MAG: DMT family transporter, partial [Planctomycetaceae bacterium]|nr:DMT family transporter [Planctomycetaceae bacterium]
MNNPPQNSPINPFSSRGAGFWSDVSLFSVAVIWGINIPLMKIGLDQLNVYVFNAVRLTISALVLATFALREIRQGRLPAQSIPWGKVCIYGLMAAGIYQLMFLLGVARTTSGNTALIMATVPMWTALLARVFLGEQLKLLAWWGLVVALLGTILVATQSGNVTTSRV